MTKQFTNKDVDIKAKDYKTMRLYMAAPELLEALKRIMDALENDADLEVIDNIARGAIAKAEGK